MAKTLTSQQREVSAAVWNADPNKWYMLSQHIFRQKHVSGLRPTLKKLRPVRWVPYYL